MLIHVIVAINTPKLKRQLHKLLTQQDVIVETLRGKKLSLESISRASSDLIIVSKSLVPDPVANTVKLIRQLPDSPQVIIISDREDPEERAQLIAAGCDSVLYSGLSPIRLHEVIKAILSKQREILKRSVATGRTLAQPRLTDFVSSSPAMQTFMDMVRRVITSDVPLLILGETGVGKERLARAIHSEGPRSEGPFITINCGSLPETLLESELFGHEEGAFTGAIRSRRGWFELAHRGTVFLDEIGELPLHLQVKLLHVLQEHEIQRVGSEKSFKVDVRVIAATNRNLASEVEAQRFRKDLFYRLSVVNLTIPPLRDRREDIPALVESYVHYLRPRIKREVYRITDDALTSLCQYSWPGNVRELINVIERAMLLCTGGEITINDLPETISRRQGSHRIRVSMLPTSPEILSILEQLLQKPLRAARQQILEDFECTYLTGLLQVMGGRIGKTAERAGIQPRSLFDKMKHHNLRKEDFRSLKK